MKLNLKRTRRFILPALLLIAALLGNLIVSTSRAAMVASTPPNVVIDELGVIGWGRNISGLVTPPDTALSGVTAIATGEDHNLALKTNGEVIGWGANVAGEVTIPAAAQSGVTAIAAGRYFSLALKDSKVIGWGDNRDYRLNIPPDLSHVTAIAAGEMHGLALSDGKVIGWGDNFYGQTTIPAGLISNVIAISAKERHNLALKSDGTVVAWGGVRDGGEQIVPDEAKSDVIAISAGLGHNLVLKSDGRVVGWGYNDEGQMTIPPAAMSDVTAIAAGNYHSLALKSDGTVIAWGRNIYGQAKVPAGLSGVIAIAAGFDYSLAVGLPLPPNTPPMAVCRNITVPIVSGCAVSVSAAQVNGGSSDPDSGDSISLSLNTSGPFGLGPHTVTLTVTDSKGASSSCTATVTVVDKTAPTITLYGANPMTVECPYGFVDPGATATDNCAGSVAVTASGSVNAGVPGSYIITYTANDGRGNIATKMRTVNVRDTIMPTLTLKPAIQLWPPDHMYRTVTMSQMVQSVSDACNSVLSLNDVKIERVTSDEPDDVKGDSDGATANDILIAADCKSVQLRAERDDKKNGRAYVITLRVRDASGNTTRKDFKVSVPINQTGAAAVQDALALTKTSGCP